MNEKKNLKEIFKDIQQHSCVVKQCLKLIEYFLAGPMCGRCLPCPMSSYEMKIILNKISIGNGKLQNIELLQEIAQNMFILSMCKKGKDVAKFIIESLEKHKDEYIAHIEKCCNKNECLALKIYKIISEKCVMCGKCLEVCNESAIVGEKKLPFRIGYIPFEIIPQRCSRCGECIKVCEYGAIEIVNIKELETVLVE